MYPVLDSRDKRATDAIAYLEGLVRSAGDAIVGVDPEGLVVQWNLAAERMLGYRADEITGHPMSDLYREGRTGEWDAICTWVLRGQAVEGFETTWLHKDATPVPLSLTVSPIHDAERKCVGLAAIAKDLTERRRAEQEAGFGGRVGRILASHPDVEQAFTAVAFEIAALIPSEQSVLLMYDSERMRLERLSAEPELTAGSPLARVLEPGPEIAAALRGRVPRIITPDARNGGLAAALTAADFTSALWYPLLFRDGVVGVLVLTTAAVDGFSSRHVELLRSISLPLAVAIENVHLLRAVQSSERKYRDLYDHAPDMLLSVGPDRRILDCNATMERVLGYSREELLGKPVSKLHSPLVNQRFREAFDQLVREGFQDGLELIYLRKDGAELYVSISSTAIYDHRGAYVGSRSVVRDITERRNLQRKVIEAAKLAAVGQLAAGVAHELNNPLSGVVGFAQLLLERGVEEDYVRDRLEKILESGNRCRRIVQDLLLYARQKGSNPEPIDLEEVVARVVRLGEYQWRVANVTIARRSDPAVRVVEADPDQMEQVFLNLITNAVDAMETGGHLSIELRTSHLRNPLRPAVDIRFTDTGPGINSTVLPRIFEPFFTTKDVGKGTGLGLSIAYSMVREHGGEVMVESGRQGGATFTVRVPVKRSPPTAAAGSKSVG